MHRPRSMATRFDKAHDVFRREERPLDPFFAPRRVALIGATEAEGSVGRTLLENLIASPFGGTVFPVNPKRESVLGIQAHASVKDLPPIDLAVIVTPAAVVPDVVRECAEACVPAAIVISAGFRELGPAGEALERRVLEEARRGRMRIIGPNCLGVMSPFGGLDATFAANMAPPGNIAFISQSGALLTAILDWSVGARVGFSAVVSVGTMLDVGWGDLIDHLGDDPHTRAMLLYMESMPHPRSFVSAARELALSRPIIVIKAGRTAAAAAAAASHTGALASPDDVLDAVFRRAGVLRVEEIGDLFHMADVLSKQPRPAGPRLTIVTNAGGPGVLATDALVTGGGRLAELSAETRAALDRVLPPAWSHGNPIDVLGDASPERYAEALRIAGDDPESDGLLVVLTPQQMTDPTRTAEELAHLPRRKNKPLLASWMGGSGVEAGRRILARAGIPSFDYPDAAAEAFCSMWSYAQNVRALYETTPIDPHAEPPKLELASQIVGNARSERRVLLDERESKALLAAYGIPVVRTEHAASADDAVALARSIGFPVVLKLASKVITHKTDVGGVALDLRDEESVRRSFDRIEQAARSHAGPEAFDGVTVQPMIRREGAYELLVGCSFDPTFGSVLAFGAGGELVEILRDRALGLPPLTRVLARRIIERTRIAKALRGARGRPPVDLDALEALLVRFADLVVEQRLIREIEINPLSASAERLVALDARVVLHGPDVRVEDLPPLVIRPYPREYVEPATLRDGTKILTRPIRPEDEPLVVDLHRRLSQQSVRLRYFQPLPLGTRTAHERLTRVCFNDYDRELALVALPESGAQIAGIGRLTKLRWRPVGEFAILISDEWQRRGLGTLFLERLVHIARREKLERLRAEMLQENVAMQRISSKLGFRLESMGGGGVVRATLDLVPRTEAREQLATA